jgi:hypothetical protein
MAALELTRNLNKEADMRELTFKELDAVSGGAWAGWVIRLWKKVMCRESDDAVNSLGDLNDYAKGTNDTYEES